MELANQTASITGGTAGIAWHATGLLARRCRPRSHQHRRRVAEWGDTNEELGRALRSGRAGPEGCTAFEIVAFETVSNAPIIVAW
jgi:hypothetical protein